MAHAYADDLQRSIESFIRDRFRSGEILSVEVYGDQTREDRAILDITVVFRGTPSEIAEKEPPGFLTKLRQFLADMHEDAFPVVSFRPTVLEEA